MPAPANPVAAAGWPTARLRQLLQLLLHMRPLRLVPVATLGSALAAVGRSWRGVPLPSRWPPERWPCLALCGGGLRRPSPPRRRSIWRFRGRRGLCAKRRAGAAVAVSVVAVSRTGLCFRGQFADPMARHRATGLLHYLATGEREPVEYQLTLAKLLCGLDDEDLLEFGEPVSDAEAEECDRALQAAIAHAQLLGEMSRATSARCSC